MAAKNKTSSEKDNGTRTASPSQNPNAKSDGKRNRARSDGKNVTFPEGKYMDEFFKEFVVLAKPLAIWSNPDGHMGIVNSIEEVIAITLHALIDPRMSPITFRVPNEIERFARATVTDKQLNVVIGTHLEHHAVMRRPKGNKKKSPAPGDVLPLEGIDAPTAIFYWLNRQDLPSWAILRKIEPVTPDREEP